MEGFRFSKIHSHCTYSSKWLVYFHILLNAVATTLFFVQSGDLMLPSKNVLSLNCHYLIFKLVFVVSLLLRLIGHDHNVLSYMKAMVFYVV